MGPIATGISIALNTILMIIMSIGACEGEPRISGCELSALALFINPILLSIAVSYHSKADRTSKTIKWACYLTVIGLTISATTFWIQHGGYAMYKP